MSSTLVTRFRATVPRTDDALALSQRVAALMGDRAWHDPLIGEGNIRLYVKDAKQPGWLFPAALLTMDLQHEPSPFMLKMHDPADQARVDARIAEERAPYLPPRRAHGARLTVRLASAVLQATYDDGGWVAETMRSTGEGRQPPLLPILNSDADWTTLEELARAITELVPGTASVRRVHLPVLCPGGVDGACLRAQWALAELGRTAGALPLGEGWLVVDGYTAVARAFAPTFDEAVGAWRQVVREVAPLPPAARPAPEPDPEPEPEPPPEQNKVVALPTPPPPGARIIEIPPVTIVFGPRVHIPYPPPGAENTPAVALQVQAVPPVSEAWRAAGYRAVRLFGDHGAVAWGLERDHDDGSWIMVGSALVDSVSPDGLVDTLDALDDESRSREAQRWGNRSIWLMDGAWTLTATRWHEDSLRHQDISRTASPTQRLEADASRSILRMQRSR